MGDGQFEQETVLPVEIRLPPSTRAYHEVHALRRSAPAGHVDTGLIDAVLALLQDEVDASRPGGQAIVALGEIAHNGPAVHLGGGFEVRRVNEGVDDAAVTG